MPLTIPPAVERISALPEGQRRIGAYRLVRPIGRGGFAPVWLAHEEYDGTLLRQAAVKLFALDLGDPAVAVQRRAPIVEEARSLCQVEHPNIVRFFALAMDDELGVMGLAMEYVDGLSLDARLRAAGAGGHGRGRLSVEDTLEIGYAVASALAAVHAARLVHRDVKPANVVEARGTFKLIDFGIAAADTAPEERHPAKVAFDDLPLRFVDARIAELGPTYAPSTRTLTPDESPALLTGTIGYIDPECMSLQSRATPESDLYALGALLFECLTGYLPSVAAAPGREKMNGAVLFGQAAPPSVRDLAPEVSEPVAHLIAALLSPAREARPRSASEVARAIDAIQGSHAPIEVRSSGELEGLTEAPPPQATSTGSTATRSRAKVAVLATLGVAAVAGALGVVRNRWTSDPAAAPPSAIGSAGGLAASAASVTSAGVSSAPPSITPPVASSCPAGMALIPAGSFTMGSPDGEGDADEHPAHPVTLPSFCLAITETTVADHRPCVDDGKCDPPPTTVSWNGYTSDHAKLEDRYCNGARKDRLTHPVNCVDWYAATAYCTWLGQRLPTEEEWEYAARGPSGRTYPWGNDPPTPERMNARGIEGRRVGQELEHRTILMYPGNDGWEITAPVGSYPRGASPFGVLDLAGNVWEWTSSPYCPDYRPKPCTGTDRVYRGGGWFDADPDLVRSAARYRFGPSDRFNTFGIRCAKTL